MFIFCQFLSELNCISGTRHVQRYSTCDSHQQCWTVALMKLYPGTSASYLCPCPAVYGSGGGGDGGGLCPAPGLVLILSKAIPGHSPSARPPGGAVVSARMLSAV